MAKINKTYDIGKAFEAIENELMASMIRNMKRHKVEEADEKKQWSMWQTEMLKSLEEYKHTNKKKYGQKFKDINAQIGALISAANAEGQMEQEKQILEAIRKGFPAKRTAKGGTAEFFKLNDRKLEALIKATTNDMQKAEAAVLRMADDQYRKIIYNAQVYANTGAGTYEKAVDMATKDFLKAGLNCIQYANGARHTIADYADMAIRTACKRAYLQGEGVKRQEWGVHTVIINKRGSGCPCPLCVPFVGKVMIDDVWSGGTKKEAQETGYRLMSDAIAAGLYHPRCRDSHTTYFPGISTPPDRKFTRKELEEIKTENRQEARQQYAERQAEKFGRLADFSLDPENQQRYRQRREEWKRKHQVSENMNTPVDEKEIIRKEIKRIREEKEKTEQILRSIKAEEKELTPKVYFDMNATPEEMEKLKLILEKKREIQKKLSDLKQTIVEKQTIYKNEVEMKLVEDKIFGKVKLSGKMTPETVDGFNVTARHLKQKYGIMPKAVVYSPLDVKDATATYNWLDDTIYVSNYFNDSEKYLETVKKSESSFIEYSKHYKTKENAKQSLEEAEKLLSDKNVKGYERSEAFQKKVSAEITLNESRTAVRENLMDSFIHEYGHFIHRHADTYYTLKKEHYGMRELGGSFQNNNWRFEVNKQYSAKAKVTASKISEYAATDPYEAFAEGFLAMEKGEEIPEQIKKVILEAEKRAGVKNIANEAGSGIMVSGARITDIFSKEADEFAEMYYREIRSFSTDARKIADNLGKEESDIKKIKAYLFEDNSLFDEITGEYRRFDPDCAIAQSWQRLMTGKDIKQHDKTLIEHELLEMKIKKENPDIEHWKVHAMAAEKYDYPKEAMEYYGNLKKHNKDK